jgi:hypothetical protein
MAGSAAIAGAAGGPSAGAAGVVAGGAGAGAGAAGRGLGGRGGAGTSAGTGAAVGDAGAAGVGTAGAPAAGGVGAGTGGIGGAAGMATAGMPAAGSGNAAVGDWPAANPAMTGPFPTVTENNVGPGMAYTMFRPMTLERRHPVITWGNGTGATPMSYRALLTLYASHGFIVIASNSENVARGTPPPMLNGVTWVLEQDTTMGSALFEKVDRENIGATGHSQGAFATTTAGADERIKTIAPLQTLGRNPGLHGPVLALCGTMDTIVPCSGNLTAYNSVTNLPVMYAELKTADHTMWVRGGAMHPYFSVTTAWFRVHLMKDQALRPMFYGACSVCQDTTNWVTMRKMMD